MSAAEVEVDNPSDQSAIETSQLNGVAEESTEVEDANSSTKEEHKVNPYLVSFLTASILRVFFSFSCPAISRKR